MAFDEADKPTDKEIVAFVRECGAEGRTINLKGCAAITDEAVCAIGDRCPHLVSLNLTGCEQITDAGVGKVGENCPQLTTLNLGGCSQITDAGFDTLREALPNCKILSGTW